MRHPDREITDPARILDIMQRCDACRLGLYDAEADEVYVVPMNFGYDAAARSLYFHGARSGRRYNLVRQRSKASFEMDTAYELVRSENATNCTARYQSIMGKGKISEVTEHDAKIAALNSIMKHYSGKDTWDFEERVVRVTAIFRLDVEELSCKMH